MTTVGFLLSATANPEMSNYEAAARDVLLRAEELAVLTRGEDANLPLYFAAAQTFALLAIAENLAEGNVEVAAVARRLR